MGYFSNGTEGLIYQEAYCFRCRNFGADKLSEKTEVEGCPIWDLHLLWSYDLCNDHENPGKQMLDTLIPRVPHTFSDGITHEINGECSMFVARPGMEIPGQLSLVTE